jgi:hypothetical protein
MQDAQISTAYNRHHIDCFYPHRVVSTYITWHERSYTLNNSVYFYSVCKLFAKVILDLTHMTDVFSLLLIWYAINISLLLQFDLTCVPSLLVLGTHKVNIVNVLRIRVNTCKLQCKFTDITQSRMFTRHITSYDSVHTDIWHVPLLCWHRTFTSRVYTLMSVKSLITPTWKRWTLRVG